MSPFFNMGDCDTCFKDAWNEASLLYGEFGYAVPNIVLWAMKSAVRHEEDNNNCRFHDHEVSYSSVSHGGALQIRTGCNPTDICAYLGMNGNNKNVNNNNQRQMKEFISANSANEVEWVNEWNDIVETLYNARYFDFEQYFWKKHV